MALPPLEYSGQTTSEILACKETHRIDSLLFALEQGIYLRRSKDSNVETTAEERLLLAVLALWREVNNGGFAQFFVNSSREYAPEIVHFLQRIGCSATAAIAQQAIGCLEVNDITPVAVSKAIRKRDLMRDERLTRLDQEFYTLNEIEQKLFRFVGANSHKFLLSRMEVAPPPAKRGLTNAGRLELALRFARPAGHSLTNVREQAYSIVICESNRRHERGV